MSKRVTISLKDSDYESIEIIAKTKGLTLRDVINQRIKNSLKVDSAVSGIELVKADISAKFLDMKKEISELKNTVGYLQNFLMESVKIDAEYGAYSKIFMTKLVRSVIKGTEEEKDEKVNEAYKESIQEAEDILKKILQEK